MVKKGEPVTDAALYTGVMENLQDPIGRMGSMLKHRRWFSAVNRRIIGNTVTREASSTSNVLEIGSGTGELARLMPDGFVAATRYVQTEPIAVLATEAQRLDADANVVIADALHLPFPDESQKIVLGLDVIDMISDTTALAREVRRVLQPGGKFLHFHDIRPNLDWAREQLPSNSLPFPNVTRDKSTNFNRRLTGFQIVRKSVYNTKKDGLPSRDQKVLDEYLHLVGHHGGLEHLRNDDPQFVDLVSETVQRSKSLQPKRSKPLRQLFTQAAREGLERGGLVVTTAADVVDEAVITPDFLVYTDAPGLEKGPNGNIEHVTQPPDDLEPGRFFVRASVNVFVAEKPAA